MTARRLQSSVVRRTLLAGALWLLGQAALVLGVRLAARRLDEGDESSTVIRRVLAMGGVELRPTNPALSRVRMDAVMGGGLVDLTAVPPVPGGIDVTVRSVMGGMALRVPRGWTVWWSFDGAMGGVAADSGIEHVAEPATADLRVHARAVMGGVSIETPKA
jgi:hypothetical protein